MTWFQQSPAATAIARRVWIEAQYKGVRHVPKNGRTRDYGLDRLSIGEAILVPYEGTEPYVVAGRTRNYVRKFIAKNPARFSVQRDDAGVLVRRVD